MTDAAPFPLVPTHVDLAGLDFTPLNVHRLMNSDLFALSTGDEFKAACALWCKSWSQVPAASVPADERILSHLAGCPSVRAWRKVQAMALRGWVLCSDGRLYHPLIAENALAAWERRLEWQEVKGNKDQRQKRWRARCSALHALLREHGVEVNRGAGMRTLIALGQKHVPGFDQGAWTGDDSPGGFYPLPRGNPAPAPEPGPPLPPVAPTRAGQVCRLMKEQRLPGVNPGDPRFLALLEQGATDEEFVGLAAEAVSKGKGWPWILTVLPARRADAAAIALAPAPEAPAADPRAWTRDRQAVEARGINLGLGPWDKIAAAQRTGETWDDYRDRVIAADDDARGQAA